MIANKMITIMVGLKDFLIVETITDFNIEMNVSNISTDFLYQPKTN